MLAQAASITPQEWAEFFGGDPFATPLQDAEDAHARSLERRMTAASSRLSEAEARHKRLKAAKDTKPDEKARERAEDRLAQAREHLALLQEEQATYQDMQRRAEVLTRELRKTYEGQGPTYEIMIRRLVQAEMHAQQLEAQGIAQGIEYDRTVNQVLKLVATIQKYNEERGGVRAEIHQGILAALQEIEAEIHPVAPQAWDAALQRLRTRLLRREAS